MQYLIYFYFAVVGLMITFVLGKMERQRFDTELYAMMSTVDSLRNEVDRKMYLMYGQVDAIHDTIDEIEFLENNLHLPSERCCELSSIFHNTEEWFCEEHYH